MPEQIVVPNEELRIEIIDNKKAENFADVKQTQLYFMDVLKFLDSLPKEPIFDLVVTSPPYNIGKEYEKQMPLDEYVRWQKKIIDRIYIRLKDTGSICWQVGNYVENGSITPLDIELAPIFKKLNMQLRNRIIWHFGHGLHNQTRFSGRYEVVMWYTKTDNYTFNLDPVRIPSKYPSKRSYRGENKGKLSCNPLGKNPEDVWDIPNVKDKPTMPLTTLQKQWLKAISLDPRVRLFGVEFPDLEDVEPLFTSSDYHVYDKYGDGDPFEDEQYIRQFRIILEAIRNDSQIKFEMVNRKGNTMFVRCRPVRLEYSEKDDKFRLITAGWRAVSTVNLAKIKSCAHYTGERQAIGEEKAVIYDTITVKIRDERNAMERFMLHFAHFEKQAEKLDKKHYLVKIKYAHDDEPEMVIRILSFGPMVEVLGSESFKQLIIEKLKKQLNCGLK